MAYINESPSFLILILKEWRNQKHWTWCQQGGYKGSFTISAFPFPRVIFDGQHYLLSQRHCAEARQVYFHGSVRLVKRATYQLKARADSNA